MAADEIDKLRARLRNDQNVHRVDRRRTAYDQKRLHLDDVENDFGQIKEQELKDMTIKVKKGVKDVKVLRRLKRAFGEDDGNRIHFVRTSGAVYGLVTLLSGSDAELQVEAAACFVNLLASRCHKTTKSVAKQASSYLILYLRSSSPVLQELSLLALGNIAADCASCCDLLKSQTVFPVLLSMLSSTSEDVVSAAAFSLRCWMQNKPSDWQVLIEMGLLSVLKRHLLSSSVNDDRTTIEVSQMFFFLSTNSDFVLDILAEGLVEAAAGQVAVMASDALEHTKCRILTFLIRAIAELCASTDDDRIASVLLSQHWNNIFVSLLRSNYEHLQKESLWLLANVACSSSATQLFADRVLLTGVANRLFGPVDIAHQALTCICNVIEVHHVRFDSISTETIVHLLRSGLPTIVAETKVMTSLCIRVGLPLNLEQIAAAASKQNNVDTMV